MLADGKLIEALKWQAGVIYTKDEKVVDRALRSASFTDMSWKAGSCDQSINQQIGIAVYQLAKQRMLMFYYDFLDQYFLRHDFELMQMDTDSNYIAISADRLEDIVREC